MTTEPIEHFPSKSLTPILKHSHPWVFSWSSSEVLQSGDGTTIDAQTDSTFDLRQSHPANADRIRSSRVPVSYLHSRLLPRHRARSKEVRQTRLVVYLRLQRIGL